LTGVQERLNLQEKGGVENKVQRKTKPRRKSSMEGRNDVDLSVINSRDLRNNKKRDGQIKRSVRELKGFVDVKNRTGLQHSRMERLPKKTIPEGHDEQ